MDFQYHVRFEKLDGGVGVQGGILQEMLSFVFSVVSTLGLFGCYGA